MEFAIGNHGSGDSGVTLFYQFGTKGNFLPASGRLVIGDDELLLRMWIFGEMDITVGFGKREFHIGKGEWHVMIRNKKNHWVSPLAPTARGYAKMEECCAEIKNCALEVLATRADVGDISEVKKLSVYRQDRRKNRTNSIENAICQLRDTFPGYRT